MSSCESTAIAISARKDYVSILPETEPVSHDSLRVDRVSVH